MWDDVVNLSVFLKNIRDAIIVPFIPVLLVISNIVGGACIGIGLLRMISGDGVRGANRFKDSFLIILCGTILLNIDVVRKIAGNSITSTSLELGENVNPVGPEIWAEAVKTLFYIAWVTGFIAFISGWKNIAGGAREQDGLGKGITKIVGGVMCMNLPIIIAALKAIAPGTPIEKLAVMLGI
jgi:hypothetical protein